MARAMTHCRAAGLASQQRWGEPHRARGSQVRPPPSYRATTPTSSMGLFETHWYRLPRQSARWALFGRRRSGSSGNGTGSSRRSSRGQPTQESILGPISMTIYINMNDGDSDAMDKVPAAPNLFVHPPADLRKVLLPPSSRPARLLRLTVFCPAPCVVWRRVLHSRVEVAALLSCLFPTFPRRPMPSAPTPPSPGLPCSRLR